MKKENNKTQLLITVFGFLGILIGTFGTLMVDYLKPAKAEDYSIAQVQQYQGVYLYLRSKPKTIKYSSLGIAETNSLTRAVESSANKKGFGKIMQNLGQSFLNDISFEKRLNEIVVAAKNLHPELQGLIFYKDLTECEMIKFK
jgi:hypothetical protein